MELDGKSFTPTHIRNNPLIFSGCAVKRKKEKLDRSKNTPSTNNIEEMEQKGDLLMCDLWQNGTYSVYYMRVVNTDSEYHSAKTPEKCLQEAERVKKKMYLEACLQQR